MKKENKTLIIILAGKETHEGMGRLANALVMAKELHEAGHTVKIVFDGAGTEWVPEITKEGSHFYKIYNELQDLVVGACDFCASAFKAKENIKDVKLLSEVMGHPSFKGYVEEGYMMVTF
ncbi:DsrE family protein [Candidatus Woesearchaeota archaeon]|nr:DsrE family protein [Candidatus Woesearchaeota archaeon]